MTVARASGTVVSYDLNYRPSLWKANGGPQRAIEVNRSLIDLVDVVFGNEEDYGAALGIGNIHAAAGCSPLILATSKNCSRRRYLPMAL